MTKSRGLRERHGLRSTKAYEVWCNMRSRCTNPNNAAFPDYGGRGIAISPAWQKFSAFFADMGEPPAGHTIERTDNDKGYTPENCRWADRKDQGRNKRNNLLLTIGEETLPLSVWAERYGISYSTIHQRLTKGWPAEHAVKTPLVRDRKGIPRGKRIAAWGVQNGVVFHDEQEQAA